MGSAHRLRDLLPTLWRPEPDAPGAARPGSDLLADLIRSAGSGFDRLAVEAGDVMQAHWFATADSALTSAWVARHRAAAERPPVAPRDPVVDAHPYLDDLPRIAALIDLAPWAEPLDQRERVEDFRRRIRRIVALYREGVGTRRSLLAMARASLPLADPDAPPGLRERGVAVEEAAPVAARRAAATTRGQPDRLVGPLMRWQIDNPALHPSTPTLHITGIAAEPERRAATVDPVIERFDPATGTGAGIGYAGTVPPGETLAITPTWTTWLAGEDGLLAATATAGEDALAGPFADVPAGPPGATVALVTGADGALWAATNAAGDGTGTLWRLDAEGWAEFAGGLPPLHALVAEGSTLLLGHAQGLSRLDVFAPERALDPDPGGMEGPGVRALARGPDGTWWAATARGAARLRPGETIAEAIGPGSRSETETPLDAVWADDDGTVFFGGAAGLFRHVPRDGTWQVYLGGDADERVPDWEAWDPDEPLPDPSGGFLPPVTALARGPDGRLWIGTDAGLAQWAARARRATYGTTLHAFPELGTGPVHALASDRRGRLWAATARGVLVCDGLDWWQLRDAGRVRLPRADEDPLAFTHWRFARGAGVWQVHRRGAARGFVAETPEPVTTAEPPLHAIAFSRGARAHLGTLGPDGFAPAGPAPGALSLRLKSAPDRIVTGGLPAIPELPPGPSHWRYLAIEEAEPPAPTAFPAWTREGRLLPPPDARSAPFAGRFLTAGSVVPDQVFAFLPAAEVETLWRPRSAFSVLVRLERRAPDEVLPDLVLDRLQAALARVRPAGVRVAIAHGDVIVRGDKDG